MPPEPRKLAEGMGKRTPCFQVTGEREPKREPSGPGITKVRAENCRRATGTAQTAGHAGGAARIVLTCGPPTLSGEKVGLTGKFHGCDGGCTYCRKQPTADSMRQVALKPGHSAWPRFTNKAFTQVKMTVRCMFVRPYV